MNWLKVVSISYVVLKKDAANLSLFLSVSFYLFLIRDNFIVRRILPTPDKPIPRQSHPNDKKTNDVEAVCRGLD